MYLPYYAGFGGIFYVFFFNHLTEEESAGSEVIKLEFILKLKIKRND